ncbi:MAG: hypothetical protein MUF34_00675 [Polyangiaceae bacterium]|jgi:hypothetical protein|nr:hypothetical protein [Polyangiaceae bacterium]
MIRHRILMGASLLAALGALSVTPTAEAQPAAAAPASAAQPGRGSGRAAASATKKEEGYEYSFTDDPLAAGGLAPNDATIRVRPGPVRSTLIKPRTSFVPEMLKSVENL